METIKKALSKISTVTDELNTLLSTLKENNKKLLDKVIAASDAYLDDLTARENKIKEQIEAFTQQKQGVHDTLESMRPHLIEATAKGDTEAIKKIQEKATDLKAQEAAIETQIDFLCSTPITGNQELFDIATAYNEKLTADGENLRMVYRTLLEKAKEQQDVWNKLYDKAVYAQNPGAVSGAYRKVVEYHNGPGRSVEELHSNSSNT